MIDTYGDPRRPPAEAPEEDEASVDPHFPVNIEEPIEPGDSDGQPT